MANYRDLVVFQKADELAYEVYLITRDFPKSEMFGLMSQLRRAALSIATNIAEGYARRSTRELKQFINVALGSHAETEYLLSFSKRLSYFRKDTKKTDELISEVGKLLWSFSRSL